MKNIKLLPIIFLLSSCTPCHAFEKEWRAVKEHKKHFRPRFKIETSLKAKDFNPVFIPIIHAKYVKPIKPELIVLK